MAKSIKRHIRSLKDGTKRLYTYAIDQVTGKSESIGIQTVQEEQSISQRLYRRSIFQHIVASLKADSSLLVVSEIGGGKTYLAEATHRELTDEGFLCVLITPSTIRANMIQIAEALGVDTYNLEGKRMNIQELQEAVLNWLQDNLAFLIFDDAHKLPATFRYWLEELQKKNQHILLFATHPPPKDIFIRLPRMELPPLENKWIRQIMYEAAEDLGIDLTPARIAALQERCAGNPMLAKRVVKEEYLGLDDLAPDHTQWIDGTPFLVAVMLCFVIVRFLGLGFNSTSLYLMGGILTVAVGVVRLLVSAMPRKQKYLGR
ncbi:ATP-binding protein [Synechococcus sp. PCC 6312]|uniref:ATP-binding protein n=1 Tax=Synechococcus sp. (strain ATCC 27167 / PCC 6312) TaxID=195253 RepID=UPI00029F38DB|nr:ATP-binding protein [Synechococcus sp. PCC 6312]AFY60846.1 hypothetical protein Syn6312_1690 [Synechococcus sp. PCC 6312]